MKWKRKGGAWRLGDGVLMAKVELDKEDAAIGYKLSTRNKSGHWSPITENGHSWASVISAKSRAELWYRQEVGT